MTASMQGALSDYYSSQQRNAQDTYASGMAQNLDNKAIADLSYQQKLQALQDRLGQEQATLPDRYAARGLLNSGIYNWDGAGQLGAKQQFGHDSGLAKLNLGEQNQTLDNQYNHQAQALGNQLQDAMSGITTTQAVDNSRQAINDAIAGA